MPSVLIKDLSTSFAIPINVRADLEGLVVRVRRSPRVVVVGELTVATETIQEQFSALCNTCYPVSRLALLYAAKKSRRTAAYQWIKEQTVSIFLFREECCEVVL